MNTKLIIFDLDGTLVDAYIAVQKSFNYALQHLGYEHLDMNTIRRNVGWGERILIAKFVKPADVDSAITLFHEHHRQALITDVQLLPYALELLTSLRDDNYHLAIASNRPSPFTQIILKNQAIDFLFDYVLCGDQLKNPKPAPDMLLQILDQFQLTPDEAIYIGDMVVDIEAGMNAGIRTIAVTTGSSSKEELLLKKPFLCLSGLNEVKEVLKTV